LSFPAQIRQQSGYGHRLFDAAMRESKIGKDLPAPGVALLAFGTIGPRQFEGRFFIGLVGAGHGPEIVCQGGGVADKNLTVILSSAKKPLKSRPFSTLTNFGERCGLRRKSMPTFPFKRSDGQWATRLSAFAIPQIFARLSYSAISASFQFL
jgi:hypothetical protein